MDKNLRLVSNIDGIHCLSCINKITNKLQDLGADKVDIDIPTKIIKVDYLGEENKADTFVEAIIDLGYKAKKVVVFDPEEIMK